MNVGLYCRVSTDTQVEGDSLEEQERRGRAWAEAHGHHVVAVYVDPGLSGKLPAAERPALLEALEALELGLIDLLGVKDLDRLSRKLTTQEAVLERIWARPDAEVWEFDYDREVQRDDDEDPMRAFMRQVVGAVKELDRAMVAKRLRDGRRVKARKGQHANGPAPYGWRTVEGELIPIPTEQASLARLRKLAQPGVRQADVAATLNAEGHRTRDGALWAQNTVSRVTRREAARTPERVTYEARQLAAHAEAPLAS